MQVEVDGSRKDCFELVTTRDAAEIEDHKITVDGPELDEIPVGSKISLSYIVEVAGKNMQSDFESVMERKIHSFLNCIEGVMHTGQRDMIRIRVSKADFEAGFRFRHIGEVLYAKIKSEFDTVVDKCQVKIVVDEAKNKELRAMANEVFNRRDDRLRSMTDESVPVFYTCIMCQAFSPSHVCIVTPGASASAAPFPGWTPRQQTSSTRRVPARSCRRSTASTSVSAATRTWTRPSRNTRTVRSSTSRCTPCSRIR